MKLLRGKFLQGMLVELSCLGRRPGKGGKRHQPDQNNQEAQEFQNGEQAGIHCTVIRFCRCKKQGPDGFLQSNPHQALTELSRLGFVRSKEPWGPTETSFRVRGRA